VETVEAPIPFTGDLAERIPIVLGVSGHLDVRPIDVGLLKSAVAAILDDLKLRYPHTPLTLLSSLARGADQLTAEVAREHRVRIVAPLPFPAEIYANSSTFNGHDEARKRFEKFVGSGEVETFVVPLPNGPEDDDLRAWEEIAKEGLQSRVCYANAGGYIVRHCHALIALWDGQPPAKPSGTAEIVLCKLQGKPPALYPWKKPLLWGSENGPVFAICAPKVQSDDNAPITNQQTKPGECRVLVPGTKMPVSSRDLPWRATGLKRLWRRAIQATGIGSTRSHERAEWQQFHQTCQTIEEFNCDADENSAGIQKRIAKLAGSTLWEQANDIALPGSMRALQALRETAAEVANRLDPWLQTAQILLFVLLFLAVLSFHLYAEWFDITQERAEHSPYPLAAFVFLLLVIGFVVTAVWYVRISERRLDYRALAEALRVRIFWGAAGIAESVADSYLGQMRTEMAWARRALQNSAPPPRVWQEYFERQSVEGQLDRLREVRDAWVLKQKDYFVEKFRQRHFFGGLLRRYGFAAAAIGWLLAAALLVGWIRSGTTAPNTSLQAESTPKQGVQGTVIAGPAPTPNADKPIFSPIDIIHPWDSWLIASGALVLLGGLLVAYCERCSHEELAKQYEHMAAVFTQGSKELESHLSAGDTRAAQDVLRALGQVAITEHSQWLILRRNRPFELLIH
jgi:hypothetical protein